MGTSPRKRSRDMCASTPLRPFRPGTCPPSRSERPTCADVAAVDPEAQRRTVGLWRGVLGAGCGRTHMELPPVGVNGAVSDAESSVL